MMNLAANLLAKPVPRRQYTRTGGMLALLAAGLLAGSCAFAQAQPRTMEELAAYAGPDREQILLDGARREGELMLYHSMPKEDMQPVVDAFEKKYGVKVKTWRASSSGLTQRITTEARGKRYQVDVIEDNAPGTEAVRRENLLQAVTSPAQAGLVDGALPPHREWVGATIDMLVASYNTSKIKPEDLPKSYQDLLDPRWKGQLGVESEDQDWYAVLVQKLGEDQGRQLFRKLVDTNGISVRKGHSLLTQLVATGEVPLALTTYNYKPAQLKRDGAPIGYFSIPPAIGYFRGTGVFRQAPHPHAALLYYDFMLSEEAQKILAGNFNIVTSNKIDMPEKHQPITFIDPGHSLDRFDAWVKMYNADVVRRKPQ